ncbi:MAG: glycoside hydrolase family 32 protein [Planctomycetota bacterium]|nr:glycoside hydrolase family 32 protein [Planctomycetota bacterium]
MTPERPHYHFTPPTGWLNDPNGLIYDDGEYHLFYQWCKDVQADNLFMEWGHAVSADLVQWEHLPVALTYDELGAIWSGSAVKDAANACGLFANGGGLVAVFTHHNKDKAERQSIATSADRGRTWTKFAGNPVLGTDADRSFRDPKVFWHEPIGRWIMVVGVQHRLYASTNLRAWTPLGELPFRSECPDLFPVPFEHGGGSKWLLSLGGRSYVLGNFDGQSFTPETPALPVDEGMDFYATQSWDNVPDGRRVWIGWINNWKYASKLPDFGAQGFMSLPRTLELREIPGAGTRMVQKPVAELAALRGAPLRPAPAELPGVRLKAYELEAELRPAAGDRCGFSVRASADGRQETRIGYDAATGTIFIDRERAGHELLKGRMSSPLPLRDGRVKLRAFVDTLSVELFFNDGEAALTAHLMPGADDLGLAWFSDSGGSSCSALTVWPLKSGARQTV